MNRLNFVAIVSIIINVLSKSGRPLEVECVGGSNTPVKAIQCHSDTPFCDNGVCSHIPGSCSFKPLNFICTSEGVFPDSTDCTKYHHCSESGMSSTVLECPRGSIYNSKLKVCQRGMPKVWHHLSRRGCGKVDCDVRRNEFVPFQTNPAFYAFCFVSKYGVKKIFMYKCADEETYTFDSLRRHCIFNCPAAGYYADSYDCNAYYVCSGFRTFTAQRMTCPYGFYFNVSVCVNSTTHCPPGSISNTHKPTQFESSTSASSSTIEQTAEVENSSTTVLPSTESQAQSQSTTVLPEFNCTSAGYYADSSDCSKYYICNGHLTFTAQQMSCPSGFYFNGSACVNSDKDCQPGSIINTPKPALLESSTSAQSLTNGQTTVQLSQISQSSEQSSSTVSQTTTLSSTILPFTASDAASVSPSTESQSSTVLQSTETQAMSQSSIFSNFTTSQATSESSSISSSTEPQSYSSTVLQSAESQAASEVSTVSPSTESPAVLPEFNCQSAGYYADSNNCSAYYICNGHQTLPCEQMSCPSGFYFNSGACVNSSEHCPLGSITNTSKPEQTAEGTQSSTQILQTTTEVSPESTTISPDLSNFYAYFPSILFLPCPLWLEYSNDQICSNVGSYINYGDHKKRLRRKSLKVENFTPLLKQSSTFLQSAESQAASELTIVLPSIESRAVLPEFNCQSAGYYADSKNCSAYYICNGRQNLPCERMSCPSGFYFNSGACVNSSEHCPLGSITNTSKPTFMETSTPAESSMNEQAQAQSTEGANQISQSTTEVSPESTAVSPAETSPSSNFYSYYPNILFLPCPVWLEYSNDQICSNVGSYINHGDHKKKRRRKISKLDNFTPLLKMVILTKGYRPKIYKSSRNSLSFSSHNKNIPSQF